MFFIVGLNSFPCKLIFFFWQGCVWQIGEPLMAGVRIPADFATQDHWCCYKGVGSSRNKSPMLKEQLSAVEPWEPTARSLYVPLLGANTQLPKCQPMCFALRLWSMLQPPRITHHSQRHWNLWWDWSWLSSSTPRLGAVTTRAQPARVWGSSSEAMRVKLCHRTLNSIWLAGLR